jgi:hypothetical protein
LGRSGLLVTRIGLGTMNFGYTVDETSSFAVMDAATSLPRRGEPSTVSMSLAGRQSDPLRRQRGWNPEPGPF